jgi:hypothetical protein
MNKLGKYHLESSPVFTVDNYKCAMFVNSAKSLDDIINYVNNIIKLLKSDNVSCVNEALQVTLPIIYRLALDDTSNNCRIASLIKELSCKLLYPLCQ